MTTNIDKDDKLEYPPLRIGKFFVANVMLRSKPVAEDISLEIKSKVHVLERIVVDQGIWIFGVSNSFRPLKKSDIGIPCYRVEVTESAVGQMLLLDFTEEKDNAKNKFN